MKINIGSYKLTKDARFIVGVTSFGMSEGATVEVKQLDKDYGKVLVDFGGGYIDWMSDFKFNNLFNPSEEG